MPQEAVVSAVRSRTPAQQVSLDNETNTIRITKESHFTGRLAFSGTIVVEGQIEGELDADRVIIKQTGAATAKVTGDSILVAGKLKGDTLARREVEIASTGRIEGDLTTPQLRLEPGASFKGRCFVGEAA